jgi:tetratricopeptide (TPR) repeat protein
MADTLNGIIIPNDPQGAVDMHGDLVSSGKAAEAVEAAALMKTRFNNDFAVQMYLGEFYEQEGDTDRADACFARALELNPSSNEARYAVFVGAIEKGRLSDARKLVSHMETPGPHQDYGELYLLASAYLDKKDYGNAYELFKVICRDFPGHARKSKGLRRDVNTVEKALGISTTILPKSPLKQRPGIYIGIAAVLLAGFLYVDHYFRTHRTLYLVNHFPIQAEVSIPGMEPVTVPSYNVQDITIAAGKYPVSIKVGNFISEKVDIDITYDFFKRLASDKDVFILNVGGSAVLVWNLTYYSLNPAPSVPTPYRLYPNAKFLTLEEIDYAFKEFPETIKIKEGSRVSKTRVDVLKGLPVEIFDVLLRENTPPPQIMDYAEAHLLITPANTFLVGKYGDLCLHSRLYDRGAAFLSKNLSRRPLLIEWHRYYQILSIMAGKEKHVLAEYDRKLKAAPDDSDYLYLRGRIEPNNLESLKYYEGSIKANPDNPYPWYAKGMHFAAMGKISEAKDAIATACRLMPSESEWSIILFILRMAMKEYDALEKESAENRKKTPLDFFTMQRMFQIYVARGEIDKAIELRKQYIDDVKKNIQLQPHFLKELEDSIRMNLAYFLQDFPEALKIAKSLESNPDLKNLLLFQGNIEQLNMNEAEKALAAIEKGNRPGYGSPGYSDLLLWLGWKIMLNNEGKAKPWLENALKDFRNGTSEGETIAALLAKQEGDVIEGVDNLIISPVDKAIVCAALAVLYYDSPRERNVLLTRAEKLNFSYNFPYYFLSKVIDKLKKKRL